MRAQFITDNNVTTNAGKRVRQLHEIFVKTAVEIFVGYTTRHSERASEEDSERDRERKRGGRERERINARGSYADDAL